MIICTKTLLLLFIAAAQNLPHVVVIVTSSCFANFLSPLHGFPKFPKFSDIAICLAVFGDVILIATMNAVYRRLFNLQLNRLTL